VDKRNAITVNGQYNLTGHLNVVNELKREMVDFTGFEREIEPSAFRLPHKKSG
jgi:hypothetical protein